MNVAHLVTSAGRTRPEHSLSWGHDEYLYQVVKDDRSEDGLAMIRYHSFHATHRAGNTRA
jgi:Myo-inositol oxygenase